MKAMLIKDGGALDLLYSGDKTLKRRAFIL